MSLGTYLNFNGNAREALEFYCDIFGGDPYIMTYAEIPKDEGMAIDAQYDNKIMHASFTVDGDALYFSDIVPGMGQPPIKGSHVQLMYNTKSFEQAKRVYEQLSAGGTVLMPFAETFWGPGFGLLEDKFGIQWNVNVDTDQ